MESNRGVGEKLQSLVSEHNRPQGLYAECVRQLGETPQKDMLAESVKDKTRDLGRKLFKRN